MTDVAGTRICKRGHLAEAGKRCEECRKAYLTNWRARHRDETRAYNAAWMRAYRAAHPLYYEAEKVKQRRRWRARREQE